MAIPSRLVLLVALSLAPSFAQAAPPAFDVASVKLSAGGGKMRGSIHTSPGTVTVLNAPLREIVRWAYGVQAYQVEMPRGPEGPLYDIVAKAGSPAKDLELEAMMQTLLADRFKLVLHRETKPLPVYEMTVAKGGPKLTPSTDEGESSFAPGKNGDVSVTARRTSMAQFADIISRPLQSPVIDKTGLKGNFDFGIDLTRQIPVDPNGKLSPDSVPVSDRETIVILAIQQQLGLKLEPKKAPIEVIIIDRAEKLPAEN